MWNPGTIFADNADKVRLLTTIIASVVAVLVVYATHALATRKNREERKAAKLEANFAALTRHREAGWKYIHERKMPSDTETRTSAEYSQAHNELQMLSAIYIPEIENHISEMNLIALLMKEDREVSLFQGDLKKFTELGGKAEREIVARIKKIV